MAVAPPRVADPSVAQSSQPGFLRELGLLDSTMIVAGSMIGSGIFIVSADIARTTGGAGWVLVTWIVTGLLTITGALCYGELATRMPHVGGQYAYLRELYSPFVGFLYGWTFFLVIQTGTIAAVAVGFARFLGVLVPSISPTNDLVHPVDLSHDYALSLNTQQLVAVLMMVLLTAINTGGIRLGRWIQNVFTTTKTLALMLLIAVGLVAGCDAEVVRANFTAPFATVAPVTLDSGFGFIPDLSAAAGLLGLLVALGVAQVGSLFSSDAWNNLTFAAGEVKDPRRTIPRALALGTGLVIGLYVLANVAYLVTLPLDAIKTAPDDRVATATLEAIFGGIGASLMAVFIVVSTFGCNNGLVLAGARVTYAMARDGLFFRPVGTLNARRVPGVALWLQCAWACLLVLPRTINRALDPTTGAEVITHGNLYGQLLDYVISAVLLFYLLTVGGVFRLRGRDAGETGARHPLAAVLSLAIAAAILLSLVLFKTKTTWLGMVIVLTGIPVYLLWRRGGRPLAGGTTPE